MAKVSISKCNSLIKNRFDLAVVTAYRAKSILASGFAASSNKRPVIMALEEIGDGKVDIDAVRDSISNGFSSVETADQFNSMLGSAKSDASSLVSSDLTEEKGFEGVGSDEKEGLFSAHNLDIDS